MKLAEVTGWVEDHPGESIIIGAGGVLVLLWLMGAFSSSSSDSSGASSLAAAYYSAEAQQAVVGGQIQMATIQTAGATAQNAANANAAVAINKAQTKAATTINGQNASAATTINQSNNDATTAQLGLQTSLGVVNSNNQLLATYSNNATAFNTVVSNNNTSVANTQTASWASEFGDLVNGIIAPEMARNNQAAGYVPGLGSFNITGGQVPNIAALQSQGYSPAQISSLFPGL